ncbi:MAG TPA: CHAT domain-containing protein [Thermoanaerobaculia bacterium]|nr:CHAT domain-containing protein [Thermoanaerobaculia bacterium]
MRTAILRIDPLAGEGYPVSLSVGGEQLPAAGALPGASLLPPMADTKLDEIRSFLLGEERKSERFREIGELLWSWLTSTGAGEQWWRLRSAPAGAAALRTVLDVRDATLALLPFELMREGLQLLFAQPDRPIARGRLDAAQEQAPLKWPLRVLVAVGSVPEDPAVEAEAEIAGIQRALLSAGRLVELVLFRQLPLLELRREIEAFKPHVFHFIGHCVEDPAKGPCLKFTDPTWYLSADDISLLLTDWSPRLVFVNACRSSALDGQGQTWAVTQAFAERAVPAVLGMQADIRGSAAASLSGPFYHDLVKGEPVDVALARARSRTAQGSTDRRDWALPQLSLRAQPEQVLPMQLIAPSLRIQVPKIPEFARIRDFVDRQSQRRRLCFGIDPIDQDPCDAESPYRDLLVLSGESEVGKSSLLFYCLAGCKLRGWQVAYVDMQGSTQDFLGTLRILRDGDPGSTSTLCRGALDPAAFNEVNHYLNHLDVLVTGRPLPPAAPGPDGRIAETRPYRRWPEAAYDFAPKLISLFCDALQRAAGGRPLVVALDHLNVSAADFKSWLLPHFIAPIAQRQRPPYA